MKVVLLRQLQQLVRAGGAERAAGGVVQHADADEQARRLGRAGAVFAVARYHRQIGPAGQARHGQQAHAQRGQAGKFHRPAGLFHHHRITGLEQGAADDVQRLRGADGGDHLRGRGVDALLGQPCGQHTAQRGVALRIAIADAGVQQPAPAADALQRGRHERVFQPLGRQHAHARLRAVAAAVEHAAHQRRRADGRVQAARLGGVVECYRKRSCRRWLVGR